MPEIDVSDIILDPFIAGTRFTLKRRRQIVNNFGEVTVAVETYRPVGSLRPTGDNNLITEAAFRAQAKSIRVVSIFPLRGVSQDEQRRDYLPDIIIFGGVHFIVTRIEDYTAYGRGFTQADCTSLHFIDRPPEIAPDMLLQVVSRNLTLTGGDQQLMAANPARVGWFVQNPETNSGPITLNEVGGSATSILQAVVIPPGGTYPPEVPNFPIITGEITVAGNAGDTVVAREW